MDEGWSVVDVYTDNDKSAAKRHSDRPEYDRLVSDIKSGRVTVVVVAATDRLQRHPGALEEFLDVCDQAGLKTLATAREGIIDLADPDALRRLRDNVNLAQWEVGRMRQRMQRRQADMAERGVSRGGGKRAFGWQRINGTRDGTVICEPEAALIREAAQRVLVGESLRAIAADWNRRSIATSTGVPWTPNSVKATLRSPRNAGLRQHKGEIVGEAQWDAILARDTFEQLQAIFNDPSRQPRSAHRDYPLSGVLRCGVCGHRLSATPRKKPIPSEPDRRIRYYGCRKDVGGCGGVYVMAKYVEDTVFQKVLVFVDDPKVRVLAQAETDAQANEIRELVQKIAHEGARLADLEDAFAAGDLSRAGLQRNAKTIRDGIDALQVRLVGLRGTSTLDRFSGSIRDHWDELTADDKRTIVQSFTDGIIVNRKGKGGFNVFDPDRVKIRWRWGAVAEASSKIWDVMTDEEKQAAVDRDNELLTHEEREVVTV